MSNKTPKQVCIIDDDPIYIYTFTRMLREQNLFEDFLIFQDPEEAFDAIKNRCDSNEELPPIIFLDLNMPIMDGWDFLDSLRNLQNYHEQKVCLFIVSSSSAATDLEKAKNYSFVKKYLIKPAATDQIKEIIEQCA